MRATEGITENRATRVPADPPPARDPTQAFAPGPVNTNAKLREQARPGRDDRLILPPGRDTRWTNRAQPHGRSDAQTQRPATAAAPINKRCATTRLDPSGPTSAAHGRNAKRDYARRPAPTAARITSSGMTRSEGIRYTPRLTCSTQPADWSSFR